MRERILTKLPGHLKGLLTGGSQKTLGRKQVSVLTAKSIAMKWSSEKPNFTDSLAELRFLSALQGFASGNITSFGIEETPALKVNTPLLDLLRAITTEPEHLSIECSTESTKEKKKEKAEKKGDESKEVTISHGKDGATRPLALSTEILEIVVPRLITVVKDVMVNDNEVSPDDLRLLSPLITHVLNSSPEGAAQVYDVFWEFLNDLVPEEITTQKRNMINMLVPAIASAVDKEKARELLTTRDGVLGIKKSPLQMLHEKSIGASAEPYVSDQNEIIVVVDLPHDLDDQFYLKGLKHQLLEYYEQGLDLSTVKIVVRGDFPLEAAAVVYEYMTYGMPKAFGKVHVLPGDEYGGGSNLLMAY